jgi:hypothetical protein
MPIPNRAERRAAFAGALQRARGHDCIGVPHHPEAVHIIRAAVDVVLGDPAHDITLPATARHRAAFLALADAIEGND